MGLPVYIDIDGTLTHEAHSPWGKPHEYRLERVRVMLAAGEQVVIWSANGEKYARAFAARYGLDGALCIGKPGKCVDDNPTIRNRNVMPILTPEEFFDG